MGWTGHLKWYLVLSRMDLVISINFITLFRTKDKTQQSRGAGTPGDSWWGCAVGFLKSRPYFRPKNVIFHTRFQTWALGRNYAITCIRAQTKKILQTHFEFAYFSLSFLLIWNGSDWFFIHSRSSLKNHTRFQTKMGEVYTSFRSKTAQKPYPMGRHIPIWLI